MEHRRRQGLRRPVEQQPRRARQGPAGAGRQAVRPVEPLPHPPGRRARDGLAERQARGGSRAVMENYCEPQAAAPARRARSSSRRTAARSAGATSSSAKSRPTRPTSSSREHGPAGFVAVFNGKDFDRLGRAGRQVRGQGRGHRLPAAARAARSTPRRSTPTSSRGWSSSCRPAATTAWPSAIPARATPPTWACASSRSSTTTTTMYAKLDPRQYHGSAYGMVAGRIAATCGRSASGTSRRSPSPARRSRWSSTARVILDCDLSKVTEFMANSAAPGQGPHLRPFRLLRPQRPGGVPERSRSSGSRREVGAASVEAASAAHSVGRLPTTGVGVSAGPLGALMSVRFSSGLPYLPSNWSRSP